jgi:8-amino-7-oxononanoate synthase
VRGPLFERIERELADRREKSLLRAIGNPRPRTPAGCIDLSTNSYLALHENTAVASEAARLAAGSLHGNLASRLVSETSPLAAALEAELASWKKTETALLFNSGYAANTGILQALCRRDTEVFCDRLNHASIIDGIGLSGCKLKRYRHNDMADLQKQLSASGAREKLIVTDTIFSMDGDRSPLADICELARRHACGVMVDEAHATGVLGPSAGGLAEELGLDAQIDIRMGTLSKAVAGVGGFFAGSALLRDYFVNYCRSLIYSTGLPHAALAFDLASVRHIRKNAHLGRELLAKAARFRERLIRAGFDTLRSTTQIVPCIASSGAEALDLSGFLRERNIVAPAIRPPTVPRDGSRLRFSVHLAFTNDHEDAVFAALTEWKKTHA